MVVTLSAPTGLPWTADGRMLVTQRAGLLRVVRDGALNPTPALDRTGRDCNNSERGLLSVLVDPAFATNHFVYLYWTNNAYNSCEMNTPRLRRTGSPAMSSATTTSATRPLSW